MGKLIRECMCCRSEMGVKDDGKPGNEVNQTSAVCDPCLELKYPKEFPKIKIYRGCETCADKTQKCWVVACAELSKRLDDVDQELRAKGL